MIDRLLNLVPPPTTPAHAGTLAAWEEIERKLGTALPSDYREVVLRYGSGRFDDFLWVLNPFTPTSSLNMLTYLDRVRSALEVWRNVPFYAYPSPGGLLAWGVTDNADFLLWKTNGSPDDWKPVLTAARGFGWEEYDCSMSELLVSIFSGTVNSILLPEDFPGECPRFVSESELTP